MNIQALAASYGPYLALVVAYYIATGILHAGATWIAGPSFATNWPRLSHLMAATGLNFVALLQTVSGNIPKPVPPAPAAPKVPPLPLLMLLAFAFAFVSSGGCTPQQAKVASDGALSVEQLACVLAQAEMGPAEPPAISAVCAIPPGLIREVDSLLLARTKGHAMALAKAPAAGCPVIPAAKATP